MSSKSISFTNKWTLFLDRDGVINRRKTGGYITNWEEFFFQEGVRESLAFLKDIFGRIIIVSNQQGVGKGLMTISDLELIDLKMKEEIRNAGGSIDAAYYSTHLATENHPDRKPGTGLGLKARQEFPEISFAHSVMAGDTLSDMQFGRNLGMVNVLISNNKNDISHDDLYDYHFDSLLSFTQFIKR
ncbi:MAG: HAD-IIIA family hydrolase [Bacteroidales bacterium]|nr:HAD-IIIA family hydrolase [Bacteroidales bacterium]